MVAKTQRAKATRRGAQAPRPARQTEGPRTDAGRGRGGSLRAGHAVVELALEPPVPLAGYITRRERLADRTRDPVSACAVVIDDGQQRHAVVTLDLLVMTQDLAAQVANTLGWPRERILFAATHTHSGPGGYWPAPWARFFMGRFRSAIRNQIVDRIVQAVRAAAADLCPARVSAGAATAHGLTANRREPLGATDDQVAVLRLARRAGDIVVVGASGHPVIVSEHAPHLASGDWPGEVRRRLAAQGLRPLVLVGSLGGLSVLFPEFPLPLETHLALVGRLVEDAALEALDGAEELTHPTLGAALRHVPRGDPDIRIYPPGRPLAHLLSWPLRRFMEAFAAAASEPGATTAPVQVLRVGPVAVAGFPCDLGVGVARSFRAAAARQGVTPLLLASQSTGYAGYIHHAAAYAAEPGEIQRGMALYENAMGFYGWRFGHALEAAALETLTAATP